jgi:4-amino-4-deoxy-L-arabinose transferase-like glycosyltransferase
MLAKSASRSSRMRTALLLGVLSFVVYNANLREISSQDTFPTRLLPVALIREGTLTLDMFFRDQPADAPLPYWVQRANGRYVSNYPLLPALLATPVYVLPIRLLGGNSWVLINVLAKLAASLIAALSVMLVYLAAARLERESVAAAIAVVYALATSTWSISSQGLWPHGPAALFLAAALVCVTGGAERPWLLDAAGVAAGLMLATRPITVFMAAAVVAYVLHRDLWRGLRAAAWCGAAVLPFVAYNVWTFGALEGGYAGMHAAFEADGWTGTWSTPLAQGLAGVLVSPSRGLFVYSPILLLALLGLGPALRREQWLFGYLAAGIAASLLILAKYSVWFGGASFGPRLCTEFMPALALFLAPAWQRLEGHTSLKVAATLFLAISIGIQAIGAFYYPSPRELDWNSSLRGVPLSVHLWDWKDTQLARLLQNGPRPLGFGGFE